jgi:hypothetical protein
MIGLEEAVADIQAGIARTIAVVCNHLIDQKVLDRDFLIADLGVVQSALADSDVGILGQTIPAAVATALRQNAAEQP